MLIPMLVILALTIPLVMAYWFAPALVALEGMSAISAMNHRGRLVLCGAVSGYGDEEPAPGPNNMFEVVTKELSIQGFMTHFRHERYDEAREQLAAWLREGKLVSPEHRLQGIDSVARAYADLFAGRNFGKTVVEL